jgi:hypothetical protein
VRSRTFASTESFEDEKADPQRGTLWICKGYCGLSCLRTNRLLRSRVEGIGPLTALTFVLTLEDPYRFEESRSVGPFAWTRT